MPLMDSLVDSIQLRKESLEDVISNFQNRNKVEKKEQNTQEFGENYKKFNVCTREYQKRKVE